MPDQVGSAFELLSRLEGLLRGTGTGPGQQPLDVDEAMGLLRMLRAALPGELAEAHRLRVEAERVQRRAQDEARRIVLEAQATAQRQAREIRDGADAYAAKVLAELDERVLRVLETIRKGRRLLKDAAG